jgi:hypothetical protein
MANVFLSSPILVTLIMKAMCSPKRRFLEEPQVVTSQKMAFFKLEHAPPFLLARILGSVQEAVKKHDKALQSVSNPETYLIVSFVTRRPLLQRSYKSRLTGKEIRGCVEEN